MLDPVKNFAIVTVSIGYAAGATSIVLAVGSGAKLPQPSTDGAFNLVWWNITDYPNPADDPSVEIVRCATRTDDTLTVTRGQEGTADVNHNTAVKIYKMMLSITKKMIDDLAHPHSVTDYPGLLADDQHVLDSEVLAVAAPISHLQPHQNLLPNSGFGVWSCLEAVLYDGDISVTSHTIGSNTVIAYTANTRGLKFGKLVKFVAGDISLRQDYTGGKVCSHTITAITPNVSFQFNLEGNKIAAGGGAATAYEAMPGYNTPNVENGDCADHWKKSTYMWVWRQFSSDIGLKGSYYCLQLIKKIAGEEQIYWVRTKSYYPNLVSQFAGRKVTFGSKVWASAASAIRLCIFDGATYTYSGYATPNQESWLEVTATIGAFANIDRIQAMYCITGTLASYHYISCPMLIFGEYIGAGNYYPIVNEVVDVINHIVPVTYWGVTVTGGDDRFIRLEGETNGQIPRGAKQIWAAFEGTVGSAGAQAILALWRNSGITGIGTWGIILLAPVNSTKVIGGTSPIQVSNEYEDTLWVKSTPGANKDWIYVSIDIDHVMV